MVISDVKIFKINDNSNTKALASITLEGEFVVTGIKVMNSAKGIFVTMPSRKTTDGEYKDIVFPVTREFRALIIEEVLEKYNKDTEKDGDFITIDDSDESPF